MFNIESLGYSSPDIHGNLKNIITNLG